ncbi:hypothetical protein K6959_01575 [Bacillus aquiflavi]|uniref:hypothetical protein n=1 Tax=Bacillus aquiflavi TaxID=2672567 RepID=UPI001CA9CF8A|nr:hypothetical protein [Bacillus aquiflavi]UAC48699.1 hypothetical protein K6959_01575 [Bacillus aquiflavi]
MKRDLQINYGILDDMIGQLHMYKHALVEMKDSLDQVSTAIQTNQGKSVEAWDQKINRSQEKIEKYETQINDLLSSFSKIMWQIQPFTFPRLRETL